MKKLKSIIAFVFCFVLTVGVYAQTGAAEYVNTLDKRVTLTSQQKTQVTNLYNGLMTQMTAETTPASRNAAKTKFNDDVRRVLTAAQRAKLDSPFSKAG